MHGADGCREDALSLLAKVMFNRFATFLNAAGLSFQKEYSKCTQL